MRILTIQNALRLEEIAMFALSVIGFFYYGGSAILFFLLILLPDIGMLGYLINPKVGAMTYNTLHHKGLAILLFLAGVVGQFEPLLLIGIIIFAHSSIDRALGYGLKYRSDFKMTHLGEIGRKE
ncbi:MAG: DUF4260 domain-containing protein [Candidatus Dojkabacteria bacterium]|nr:MAG: DUF4260 domain-containing protein [Candidatus Dojkabacteria bacterium]